MGPDGTVFLADSELIKIRSIEPPLDGFSGGGIAVASPDGSEVFRFDAEGTHLETFDAVTGVLTYAFGYDVDDPPCIVHHLHRCHSGRRVYFSQARTSMSSSVTDIASKARGVVPDFTIRDLLGDTCPCLP